MIHTLFLFSILLIHSVYCYRDDTVNIHFVPHTHDDVGWLKTIDQYYYGANESIQVAGVQYILDSVIPELMLDPSRHFIYVEMAFFMRWWREQDDVMRVNVRKLVSNGQLEFINGGWCMNDEAGTHYNAIIDQMSLGLRFIRDEFGDAARPSVAWHIDPFGHSAEQASINSMIGFDSFYFARIDYQDYKAREKAQKLQMVWQGSATLGANSNIFTGALYHTTYGPPNTFCFDIGCRDPPIQDDPNLFDYNVDERVKTFINFTLEQAKHHRTSDIMLTMGSDFQYMNAKIWYKNMDKLMKYVNKDSRVNAFYSTPSKFTKALYDADLKWDLKTDDFFPYADCPSCFWTGYFTSRPALKGYVRELNSFLQSCRHLEFFATHPVSSEKSSEPVVGSGSHVLEEAMGVAQHHDAVSGTEKQHVANDYAMRLHIGQISCQHLMKGALNTLINGPSTIVFDFEFCEYLNISSCAHIQDSESYWFIAYNPMGRVRKIPLRLPVKESSGYSLSDVAGNKLDIDLFPVSSVTKTIAGEFGTGEYELNFIAELPPLGYTRFELKNNAKMSRKITKIPKLQSSDSFTMKNDKMSVTFSNGELKNIIDLTSGVSLDVGQNYLWYNSSTGNTQHSKQASGAYIFRPNSSTPVLVTTQVKTLNLNGKVVNEARQTFSNWVSQVVRIFEGKDYVEFEYTVGPVPFKDGMGREVVSMFCTPLVTHETWYTDANGRSMQKRVRNFRPTWKLNQTEPAAGNYYPVNSRIALVDEQKGIQFVVLNDRSQGGASLKDGCVELMVHRRTLVDDRRGVAEPINETGQFGDGLIIRGKHFVIVKPVKDTRHRSLGEEIMMPPVLAFSGSIKDKDSLGEFNFSALTTELPRQIHLLTLMHDNVSSNTLLLRFEHMFEDGEDNSTVSIGIAKLFKYFTVTSVTELGLAANVKLSDISRLHFATNNGVESRDWSHVYESPYGDDLTINLKPMQIRTFSAVYEWNK